MRTTALILINNFAHDLFTGMWCGGFITLGLLQRQGHLLQIAPAQLIPLNQWLFDYLLLTLGLVLVTGMARGLYQRSAPTAEAPLRLRLLIIKHLLLGTLFAVGTTVAYQWTS